MSYIDGDYELLANAIMEAPPAPIFVVPPKAEIIIEDATIGIWEFEDSFAYCEKGKRGYLQYKIIQIDKRIINAMKGE